MYQVFVVEDEMLIRQHIRKNIEAMDGLFACCGEASDGEMALSIIQDLMPDILITDIRMPFLDGFGLIRHAKAIMPWLKVMIISGFDDFEYARTAITLGANAYLLKPVSSDDLRRELHKLAAEIAQDRNSPGIPDGFNESEVDQALRQHYVQQLIHGSASTTSLLDKASALKLDILRAHYRLALFSFDDVDFRASGFGERIMSLMHSQHVMLYDYSNMQLTVFFCDNDLNAMTDGIYRLIGILRHELGELCPVITVVVSGVVNRLSRIADAHRTAADLLNKAKLVSAGQVIDADDAAQLAALYIDFNEPFGAAFRQRMLKASADEVETILDAALSGPNGQQFNSVLMRYYALLEIMKTAVQMIRSADGGQDEKDIAARLYSECDINLASCEREAFRPAALKLMRLAVKARQERSQTGKHYHVINRAVAYVQEHFNDPNITLISVADDVGMSTAHFSTVFSQNMGKPFIAYLTALRIEKAKELLATTDRKLSEIAMEIGYNEPNYFSHVFKKSEGMTPKEYRSQARGELQ